MLNHKTLAYSAFLLFGTSIAFAQTPIVPPPNLIAWWPGDGSGTEVVSASNAAIINGATYATGEVAQAFSFNGTSSYAQAADSPQWAFGTNEFSIELWAYFANATGQRAFVASDTGGGAQNKWIFWMNNNVLQFHINGTPGTAFIGTAPFNPTLNQWYHVAVTRKSTNYVFYINGSAVSTNVDSRLVPDAVAPLTIGSSEGALFFNGRLDEVSIYSRALAGAEIANIYNAGTGGKDKAQSPPLVSLVAAATNRIFLNSAITYTARLANNATNVSWQWLRNGTNISGETSAVLSLPAQTVPTTDVYSVRVQNANGTNVSPATTLIVRPQVGRIVSPVAQWHFDEAPGATTAADVSTNAYTGTLSASGASFTNTSWVGNALALNQASNGLVNMGNILPLTNTSFTIVLWARNTEATTQQQFLSRHATGTANGYFIQENSSLGYGAANKASLFTSTPGSTGRDPRSATSVNDDQWHQIVSIHRGDLTQNRIYVDGAPLESTTGADNVAANNVNFLVGGVTVSGTPTANYNGLIDEVQIFNRELTDDQIDYLYTHPASTNVDEQNLATNVYVWVDPVDGLWSDPQRWTPLGPPPANATAIITNAGNYTVTVNSASAASTLLMGFAATNATGTRTLAITAGSLTVTNATLETNTVLNLSAGTLTVQNVASANGQFNWTGGVLAGNGELHSETAGSMTISGAGAKTLIMRALGTYGSGTWSGAAISAGAGAIFYNAGTLTIPDDVTYVYNGGVTPTFINYGTLNKSAGSGQFFFSSTIFRNEGSASISSGTLAFNSATFTNNGGLYLSGSAFLDLNAGSVATLNGLVNSPATDHLRVQGATVYLTTTNVISPTLLISSGILNLATNATVATINQSGGVLDLRVPASLANYNLTNGELRGRDLTVTNFNWYLGNLNSGSPAEGVTFPTDRTIIPAGGVLNILGVSDRYFSFYNVNKGRGLDNFGTINWSAPIQLHANNSAIVNNYGNVIVTGNAPNVQYDYGGGGAIPVWNNFGTFTRSNGASIFYFDSVFLNNSGSINIQSGTLSLYGSTVTNSAPGSIQISAGVSIVNDAGATTTLLGGSSLSAVDTNSIHVTSGSVYLATTNISSPSIVIDGGVLYQLTNMVVNVINESAGSLDMRVPGNLASYNLTGGELRGRDLTITNFNWTFGNLNSGSPSEGVVVPTDRTIIPPGGVMNILGTGDRYFSYYNINQGRGLDNRGTINWSAPIQLHGNNTATVNNFGNVIVTGNAPNVQYDAGGSGAIPVWNNYGTFTRNTGASIFYFDSVYLNNFGTFNINSGTFSIYGTTATNNPGGQINMGTGTVLINEAGSTTTLLGGSTLSNPDVDSIRVPSGSLNIASTNVFTPSLQISGGVVYQMTNIVVGTINESAGSLDMRVPGNLANYNLTGGELRGRDLTITNFNWTFGNLNSGSPIEGVVVPTDRTIIPPGGVLNILGASDRYFSYYSINQGRGLDNYGTVNWSAPIQLRGQNSATVNNYGIVLVTGGAPNVQYDHGGSGAIPVWNNFGTLTRSNGTSIFYFDSVILNNSGNLNIQTGMLSIFGSTFTNAGPVNITGTQLQFWASTAYNSSSFNIAPAALVTVENGSGVSLLPSSSLSSPGSNSVQVISGSLTVNSTNLTTPSLLISGGTVYQYTNLVVNTVNESAGALELRVPANLAQYNLTGGELRGRNLTVTNFNWAGGNLNTSLPGETPVLQPDHTIIPPGGVANYTGTGEHYLSYWTGGLGRTVDNYGTWNWSGIGHFRGNGGAIFNNLGSTIVTATNITEFRIGTVGPSPVWNNYGTFTKNTGTNFFYFESVYLNNTNLIDIQSGPLSIYASTATNLAGGLVKVAAGSYLINESGSGSTLNPGSALLSPDLDSVRLPSGSLSVFSTNVSTPSFLVSGGILYQFTNLAVGTINQSAGATELRVPASLGTYNLNGGELRGRNLTVTNLNWSAGAMQTSFPGEAAVSQPDHTLIPAGGIVNYTGTGEHYLSYWTGGLGRTVDNFGSWNWSGSGHFRGNGGAIFNNFGTTSVTATNITEFRIGTVGPSPVWNNYGTFTKTVGTNLFYFESVYLNNTNLISIQSGPLSIYASTATNYPGGNISLGSGVQLFNESGSGTTLLPGSVLAGSALNSLRIPGGTVYLLSSALSIPSLSIEGGTLQQLANNVVGIVNQSAGIWQLGVPVNVTTYNLSGGYARGNADITMNNFNWTGGSLYSDSGNYSATVSDNLYITSGGTKTLSYFNSAPGRHLINNGTAIWGGASITASGGVIFRNNNSLTVTGDVALVYGGSGATPALYNTGTYTKSGGTGTAAFSSTTITNTGTFSFNVGSLAVGNNFIQTAGSSFLGTNFSVAGAARNDSGIFTGRGTIAGSFFNNGLLNPGASPGLVVAAHFTNTAPATVNVELGGATGPGTNYDQIRLTGNATLSGAMNVTLANNFAPQLSNSFTVMTFASRSGTYSSITPPPGVTLDALYSTTNLVLTVIGLTNAPLEITSFPTSQTVWTPDPVTFTVGVSGSTPISYQWQRFATNLPNATNSSFSIPSVTVPDAGTYTVLITDGYGGTTNASATLTVIPFAGTIYWTNVAGGDWGVANNWEPKRVPNATNTAMIISNGFYTVNINSDATVSNLVVGLPLNQGTQTVHLVNGYTLALRGNSTFSTNTTLALNGTLQTFGGSNHFAGQINWQLGTLSGLGRSVIATNATLTFVGSLNQKFVVTNILENYGTWNYGNDSFGNAQMLRFSGGASLTNYPSGVINIGTAALDYSGAQTPRSYLLNFGTINTASANVFAPSYLSIDFYNYGLLYNYGYVYIGRGANYGTIQWYNTLAEVSVFGDESTGEYFSFEDGTVFIGALPHLAVGGYAQWNTTAPHAGDVRVAAGSGGASFASPEFRILKNYTQTGTTTVNKGRWTMANSNLVANMNTLNDSIYNGFHSFVVSNAGTIYVNNLSHTIRNLANGGNIIVLNNLSLSGGATYATGRIVITNGATGTFNGGSVDAQLIENYGTNSVGGALSFSGNTFYRNRPGARTVFNGGSFVSGPAAMLNESLVDGFGGVSGINFTNRATVLANDPFPFNRNLGLGFFVQETGLTECGPGALSGTLDIQGGTFRGTNAVSGSLRNSATFRPGKPVGQLSVSGNFTNQVLGSESMVIGGTNVAAYSRIDVGGTAYLGGTLNVSFTNGFLPVVGNTFTAMTYTARSGVFDNIVVPNYQVEALYLTNALILRASNALPVMDFWVSTTLPYICNPAVFNTTGTDLDGSITNVSYFMDNVPLVSIGSNRGITQIEFDIPVTRTFQVRITDDRGGTVWATQSVTWAVMPIHVLTLGGMRTNNHNFKICMVGSNGANYMVLMNTNLLTTNWLPIGLMNNFTNDMWRFFDPNATNVHRYYRALKQ